METDEEVALRHKAPAEWGQALWEMERTLSSTFRRPCTWSVTARPQESEVVCKVAKVWEVRLHEVESLQARLRPFAELVSWEVFIHMESTEVKLTWKPLVRARSVSLFSVATTASVSPSRALVSMASLPHTDIHKQHRDWEDDVKAARKVVDNHLGQMHDEALRGVLSRLLAQGSILVTEGRICDDRGGLGITKVDADTFCLHIHHFVWIHVKHLHQLVACLSSVERLAHRLCVKVCVEDASVRVNVSRRKTGLALAWERDEKQ